MLKTLGCATAAVLALLFVLCLVIGFSSRSGGNEGMAVVQAHNAVRGTLYNPNAADFKEPAVQPTGPHAYRITGVVYSTNGYGGVVPATYEVLVDFSGEGRDAHYGHIVSLKVNDTVYR